MLLMSLLVAMALTVTPAFADVQGDTQLGGIGQKSSGVVFATGVTLNDTTPNMPVAQTTTLTATVTVHSL